MITVFLNADIYIIKFVNKIEDNSVFINIIFNNFGELVFVVSENFINNIIAVKIKD